MKHISWNYPIVCQTEKEDFIKTGKDVGGGEILSVKQLSKLSIIKSIWRQEIHAHGRGFPFPEMASVFAKKSVYSPHNDTIGSSWFTRFTRRFVFNRYDKIIAQTEYGKNRLIESGIQKKKIVVIPAAVDYNFFSNPTGGKSFRKKYNLGKDPFILAVGIRALKNPMSILRACERTGVKAVMIGPYKKEDLEKTWKGKGFEWYLPPEELLKSKNVVLPGQLSGKDFLAALDAATVFVNSSDYESFGLAVYEAAASGIPLCLPDQGTFDAFRDCALFHENNNEDQLSNNIKIYINNPMIRRKNTRKAKEIAKNNDYEIIKDKYTKLYKSLNIIK